MVFDTLKLNVKREAEDPENPDRYVSLYNPNPPHTNNALKS
jgi:hypothetical protein